MIDVLANDNGDDIDPTTLRIVTGPQIGSASIEDGAAVVYAAPSSAGTAILPYQLRDIVGDCDTASLAIAVVDDGATPCTITETPSDELPVGTPGNGVVCGVGGDDEISGDRGDDVPKGGTGHDHLDAGQSAQTGG